MIEWLAIIVICKSGECGFWADTKIPYQSETVCQAKVIAMSQYFEENGVEVAISGCIPVKFIGAKL